MRHIWRPVIPWDHERCMEVIRYYDHEGVEWRSKQDPRGDRKIGGITAEGPVIRRFPGVDARRGDHDLVHKGVRIDIKAIITDSAFKEGRPQTDWFCQVSDYATARRHPEVYLFVYIDKALTRVCIAGWILASKFNLIATPLKEGEKRGEQDYFKGQRFNCHEVRVRDLEEAAIMDDWED